MSNLWHCYSWRGAADAPKGDIEPVRDWNSAEGAVEFLRRELLSGDHHAGTTLVTALADLRSGGSVSLRRDLGDGTYLHLEIVPESV